jgi:hypothetical protein
MLTWVGPLVVAPCWAIVSVHLVLQGWLATAKIFIALVALMRGRMSGARTLEALLGAFITGLFCSFLLRAGFWLLLERKGFGRTWPEQIVYVSVVALSASLMLGRLPSRLQRSWRAAMTEPVKEGGLDQTPTAVEAPSPPDKR